MKTTMQQNKLSFKRPVALACGIFLALLSGQAGLAQQTVSKSAPPPPQAAATAKPAAAEEATAKPGKPGSEGIKVHGHWIIDVRNPDGTLAQHRDFENSLYQYGGAGLLMGLMSGQLTAGNWMISLLPYNLMTPCATGSNTSSNCNIAQLLTTYPALTYCTINLCSAGLTVTPFYGSTLGGGGTVYTLTLAGSITANQAGALGSVQTVLSTCGATNYIFGSIPTQVSNTAPSVCSAETSFNNIFEQIFTSTGIQETPVASGQLIQVTVVISFS